jgi:hypothetical protein
LGFVDWQKINRASENDLLRRLPRSHGAYVMRRNAAYARVCDISDILYVGSATNGNGLKGRIRQYFHPGPTQRTNRRILALVGDSDCYEISWKQTESIGEARQLEQDILDTYLANHRELPPENRKR